MEWARINKFIEAVFPRLGRFLFKRYLLRYLSPVEKKQLVIIITHSGSNNGISIISIIISDTILFFFLQIFASFLL